MPTAVAENGAQGPDLTPALYAQLSLGVIDYRERPVTG